MPKWNVSIAEETDRAVRSYLARTGMKKGDLSAFVEDAVQGEMLRRGIQTLKEKNPDLSDADARELVENLSAIERGMDDVRAGRVQPMKRALQEIAGELGLRLEQ